MCSPIKHLLLLLCSNTLILEKQIQELGLEIKRNVSFSHIKVMMIKELEAMRAREDSKMYTWQLWHGAKPQRTRKRT